LLGWVQLQRIGTPAAARDWRINSVTVTPRAAAASRSFWRSASGVRMVTIGGRGLIAMGAE